VLATRLVAILLSVRDGATMDRVKNVISTNPDAITAFLAGEQSYRRGRYDDASHSFLAAYQRDSTFALAALRLEIVDGWLVFSPIPGDWLRRAWTNRERLSGADRALLDALAGPTYPALPTARNYERTLFAAAERTNSAELWYEAGDVALHRYRLSGDSTYPRRALDAFRRAEALDSSFVPALEHQSSLYEMLGDSAGERAAWQRQRMLDSAGDFFRLTDAAYRAMHSPVAEAVDDADHRIKDPVALHFAASWLTADVDELPPLNDGRLTVADAFERAADKSMALASDPQLVLEQTVYWINTGRPRAFAAAPSADSALTVDMWNTIAGLVWDGDSAIAARSARQLVRWAGTKDTAVSLTQSSAYLAAGLWSLSRGDTVGVERARAGLKAMRVAPESPLGQAVSIHEKLLAAHLSVARKAPDAKARLTELDSLLIDGRVNRTLVANLGNLLVSRLWEDVGDDQRALDAINRRHLYVGAGSFSSSRLKARARIAERLGMREEAIRSLRKFVGMRSRSDPQFRAELTEARATLAKLEKQSTGR